MRSASMLRTCASSTSGCRRPSPTRASPRRPRSDRSSPSLGVLVLSHHIEPSYAMRLISDYPARTGYLLKERLTDGAILRDSLQRIAEGETVIDPTIVAALMNRTRTIRSARRPHRPGADGARAGRGGPDQSGDRRATLDHRADRRVARVEDLRESCGSTMRAGRTDECSPCWPTCVARTTSTESFNRRESRAGMPVRVASSTPVPGAGFRTRSPTSFTESVRSTVSPWLKTSVIWSPVTTYVPWPEPSAAAGTSVCLERERAILEFPGVLSAVVADQPRVRYTCIGPILRRDLVAIRAVERARSGADYWPVVVARDHGHGIGKRGPLGHDLVDDRGVPWPRGDLRRHRRCRGFEGRDLIGGRRSDLAASL